MTVDEMEALLRSMGEVGEMNGLLQFARAKLRGEPVEFFIPGEAPSAPNLREHWAVKARRAKAVGRKVATIGGASLKTFPALLAVQLERIGARLLDDDNLRGALKAHRDAIARALRVDDATPLVRWEYSQQTDSKHGVKVRLWRL